MSVNIRERTIPARTNTCIRVYTTADTNTSTPCIGVPATYIIRPGRSLGECSLYAMGGTCRPLVTNQLARSVSCTTGWFAGTLEWLTADCCYHFLLVDRVRRHLSLVAKTQYCAVLVSWGGWYQVIVSLLPPLQSLPYHGSNAARAAGNGVRMSFDLLCNATC